MSNYTDTLQRGDKIGCYRIEEVLGRGGFAVTYLATDENLDVEVAIKEYLPREITQRDDNLQVSARKPEFAEDYDVGLDNFAREAKTLARFKHPHIVRVHQVLHANNTAYMVMDFEQGEELGEVLERHQTLTEDELRGILLPILDGVEEIHRHGFVHRDIKPSNIYVRHNGSPVLIDFGAARYTMSETTQQLTAVVTVGYTPIEQYNVSEDAQGPWSDIYALAAVCYEAVTGDVPTDSVTRASASVTKGDDPLPSVRTLTKREYSDDCLDAIDWGLRMDSEDRPQVIAQWRDSFDGIFNPASAYVTQKGDSIYSSHRAARSSKPRSEPATQKPSSNDEVVSIPLRGTDTSMDAGVVALNTDSNVTNMPPLAQQSPAPASGNHLSEHPSTRHSANDPTPRNVLRRDSETNSAHAPEQQSPKRSKFDRPSHLAGAQESQPHPRRTVRDEIEFDESDWDYVPPQKTSSWKLLFPALGLAAVVGASVLYVNSPELITNLVKGSSELSSIEALEMAEQKFDAAEFIFPAGDSAVDYYQMMLKEDPDSIEAKAGIRSIESVVRKQIADNMNKNNVSEAERILARADTAGLVGLYGSESTQVITTPEVQSTTAATSPVVTPEESVVITPINTTSLDTSPTTSTSQNVQSNVADPVFQPSTGIDNNISPYIQGKIDEISSLIEQDRFEEARAIYSETDKFIPNQATSRELLQKIQDGETAAAAAQQATTDVAVATPETQPNVPIAETQTIAATNTNTVEPEPVPSSEPPRNSYIDASGPAADHLNQLRLAIEAKDIDTVQALSQTLPEGRIRFLNSTFARHHRLDVIIDDVTTSGDTISGKLNVAMFGKGDDGSVYGAGKWNGVIVEATRDGGEWQKIRW